jgi:hypothetical protein
MPDPENQNKDKNDEFEKASQKKQGNLLSEFMGFLKQNRKFWLLPLILVMLALAALLILSSSFAAPFIYTLF